MNNKQKIIEIEWSVNHTCNLDCSYCYLARNLRTDKTRNRDIDAFAITHFMNSLGAKCNLIMYGGEPFIIPNLIDACKTITKNHYASFVTNLVGNKIDIFAESIDPDDVLFIRPSLHYEQLVKTGKKDIFIRNYHLLKQRGFNLLEVEMVIHPSEIDRFDQIFSEFLSHDITIKPVVFEGLCKMKLYPMSYNHADIEKVKKTLMNTGLPNSDSLLGFRGRKVTHF